MSRTRVKLALFGVLVLVGSTPLWWKTPSEEYRNYVSPDGRYKVMVARNRKWFSMPGQSSDAPGWVGLYDLQHRKFIARKSVEMVQVVDQVTWSSTNVDIKFVAEWPLP